MAEWKDLMDPKKWQENLPWIAAGVGIVVVYEILFNPQVVAPLSAIGIRSPWGAVDVPTSGCVGCGSTDALLQHSGVVTQTPRF